jgi:UPF0755 protein
MSLSSRGFIGKVLVLLICGLIFFVAVFRSLIAPPADFPAPYHLKIEPGQSLVSISNELARDGVIKSPRIFEMFMLSFGSDKRVSTGEYYFAEPTNALTIALRISGKQFGIDRKRVTFPEGFTNQEMADRLVTVFPDFDKTSFLELSKDSEGYLFPDTYGFFPSLEADMVVTALKNNFNKKIAPLEKDIASSGHTRSEIITMASIIEKEANGEEDRAMVSGILWKRIKLGMPLQVDAPFLFLFNKTSAELTAKDLATKSPYNLYQNKGLTPTPINNPGLKAIEAAIHPSESTYMYYLHDKEGKIHYASTYTEHRKNIQLYLK